MNEMTPQQARERAEQGAILVDVREPDEYNEVHAEGVTLMPLSRFEREYASLPKDAELIMVCRSGARSERAGSLLLQNGYSNVTNMKGGTQAWVDAGLPTGSGAQ